MSFQMDSGTKSSFKNLPVHHFGYITRSIMRSMEIYETMGFIPVGEIQEDMNQRNWILFLEKPGQDIQIELIEPMEGSTMARWPEGLQHICFDATCIQDFAAWFREKRLGKIYQKDVEAPALGGARVCFVCFADRTFGEFIVEKGKVDKNG